MEYATTRGERTVAELAGRLFGVGERTAVAKRAVDALVSANPELERIEELPRGTIVEVPEVARAELAEELPALPDVAAATVVRGAAKELGEISDLLEAIIEDRVTRAEKARAVAKDSRVKQFARDDEAFAESLEDATADAEAELAEARALRREQGKALDELAEDLVELAKVVEE